MSPVRAAYAEFVGTFALVFVGGGAVIVTGGDSLLAAAFGHGLILAVMVVSWIGMALILGGGLFVLWRESVVNRQVVSRRPMPRNRQQAGRDDQAAASARSQRRGAR